MDRLGCVFTNTKLTERTKEVTLNEVQTCALGVRQDRKHSEGLLCGERGGSRA